MSQNRILLFVVALACGLGLLFSGCDKNPLPDWEDPWPTGGEAPTISAATPDSALAGATVKLSGSGMNATADNNFVLLGSGTGLYLCDVSAATASEVSIAVPEAAENLPFDDWTIIDTIMGTHFAAYPDSEIASIDTTRNVADDADSLYDTTWTVYATGPDTVTTDMAQTTSFVIKMSARGSELWSNTLTFRVIPPDEDREYRQATLVVLDKNLDE
ncbi:hypothetical protein ACFLT7_01325 [candidate division KSB1 bacterium]